MGDANGAKPGRSATALKMFATTEHQPCPYLEGQMEQRLFTSLAEAPETANAQHDVMMRAGFRRSQAVVYRPICPTCDACRSIRIPVARLERSRSLRKVWNRNRGLVGSLQPARFSDEHYQLFDRYILTRHADGGMASMSRASFRRMLEDAPVTTFLAEFRDGAGKLVAASLTDRVESGFSGVYKYFEPEMESRSLGTYMILWLCKEADRLGLPFLYLGYWIEGSRKMAYKARFRPLEVLDGARWRPFVPPDGAADSTSSSC